ncbi:hypothetical protein VTO42DRAFT_3360 [Malbranchea cinnamomea]
MLAISLVVLAFLGTSSALKLVDYSSLFDGAVVDLSEPLTFTWESVETDPETFGIELVNMHVYPPIRMKVTSGVHTEDETYTVHNTEHLHPSYYGRGFQFNLVAEGRRNTGILAQSGQFSAQRSREILVTPTRRLSSPPTTVEETATPSQTETGTETATESETETGTSSTVPTTLFRVTPSITQVSPGYGKQIGTNTPTPDSGGSSVFEVACGAACLVALVLCVFF